MHEKAKCITMFELEKQREMRRKEEEAVKRREETLKR